MRYLLIFAIYCIPLSAYTQLELKQYITLSSRLNIISVDIDGDGDLDIVGGDDGLWHENLDGNGTFRVHQLLFPDPQLIDQIDIGDIDGDGDIDLLVGASHYIHWYENSDGKGNFDLKDPILENAEGINDLQLFDKDGDGDLDIFYFQRHEEVIMWIENIDDNNLFEPAEVLLDVPNNGNPSIKFELVDFNDDGLMDLFYILQDLFPELGEMRWAPNLGNGEFGTLNIIELSNVYYDIIKTVDYDSDGDLDIITYGSNYGANPNIKCIQNDGIGNFDPAQILVENTYVIEGIEFSDIDNDNDLDILAQKDVNYLLDDDRELFWYENLNGSYGAKQTISLLYHDDYVSYHHIMSPDIDGDGFNDIVMLGTGNYWLRELSYWKNESGSGDFTCKQNIGLAHGSGGVQTVDMDGDSDLDIVSYDGNANWITWFENIGDSLFIANSNYRTYIYGTGLFVAGDFNGDEKPDIINKSSSSLLLSLQTDSSSGVEFEESISIGYNVDGILMTDYDDDGDNDLLVSSNSGISKLINTDGLGNFEFESITDDFIWNGILIFYEDMDNDGFKDVIVDNYLYRNLGSNGFAELEIIDENIQPYDVRSTLIADFNGDGLKDIVFSVPPEILYKENLGVSGFGASQIISDNSESYSMESGDFDGDGDLDIFANGNCYENTNGTFSSVAAFQDGSISVNDFDNDGDADVIVNGSRGLKFYKNSYGNTQLQGVCFLDENENGVWDETEPTLWDQKVRLNIQNSTIGTSSWTTNDGRFSYVLRTLNYSLQYIQDPDWSLTTDSVYNFEILSLDDNYTFNFGLIPNNLYTDITPQLNAQAFRCDEISTIWLDLQNKGTLPVNGNVKLVLHENMSFVNATPIPDFIDADTVFWNFENISPSQHDLFFIEVQIPDANFIGTLLNVATEVNALDGTNNVIENKTTYYNAEVLCGYDPNDKLITPDPPGEENYTEHGDSLIYTIRFQNTGNDTAKNITILDDLDTRLDLNTFEPVASSHPYEVFIAEFIYDTPLRFEFKDINLPDSVANEPASHGFVKFKILPKTNLPDYFTIFNSAEIIFDTNPPIVTNTTKNTFTSFAADFETNQSCIDGTLGSINANILFGAPPYSYLWSNGSSEEQIDNLTSGPYSLTITDGFNDEHYFSFDIETSDISGVISSTPATNNMDNGTVTIEMNEGTPPFIYTWNTTPIQNTASVSNLSSGTYTVNVTDANECILEETVVVELLSNSYEIEELNRFDIFPNPASSNVLIDIEFANPKNISLEFTNVLGQRMNFFSEKSCKTFEKTVNVKNLESGVYIVNLEYDTEIQSRKLVILNQ